MKNNDKSESNKLSAITQMTQNLDKRIKKKKSKSHANISCFRVQKKLVVVCLSVRL